jgi:hypothetical protein
MLKNSPNLVTLVLGKTLIKPLHLYGTQYQLRLR